MALKMMAKFVSQKFDFRSLILEVEFNLVDGALIFSLEFKIISVDGFDDKVNQDQERIDQDFHKSFNSPHLKNNTIHRLTQWDGHNILIY